MIRSRIPVSAPWLDEEESRHVNQALQQGAISGFFGDYLPRFEGEFAAYCGCAHGVAVSSGTTALHLALATLRIGPGKALYARHHLRSGLYAKAQRLQMGLGQIQTRRLLHGTCG